MPMFKPVSENEATGKVKEIFNEIKNTNIITKNYCMIHLKKVNK